MNLEREQVAAANSIAKFCATYVKSIHYAVWWRVWTSFNDPVPSQTGESHNYCSKEAKCFVLSRQGNYYWCGCQWMHARKRMPPQVVLFSIFGYRFCHIKKFVFPLPLLQICVFPSAPSLRVKSNLAIYTRKCCIFCNLFVMKTSILQIILSSHLYSYIQV